LGLPLVRESGEFVPHLSEETSLLLVEFQKAMEKPLAGYPMYFSAHTWCDDYDPQDEAHSVINVDAVGVEGSFSWPKIPWRVFQELVHGRHVVKTVIKKRSEFAFVLRGQKLDGPRWPT
jgi:hypothetical protein